MKQVNWDKLEDLPYRQNRWQYYIENVGSFWNFYDYRGNNKWYKICIRILENNIGKSYDMTYHYLCTKVPYQHRYHFEYQFNIEWWRNRYYVDENGLIQKYEIIRSWKIKHIENRKDPAIKRYYAEKQKAKRKAKRLLKKQQREKKYSFIPLSELNFQTLEKSIKNGSTSQH